jgi:uncharacterized membrane protein YbhN (UPF0104 family)
MPAEEHAPRPPLRGGRSLALHGLVLAVVLGALIVVIIGVIPDAAHRLAEVDPGWVVVEVLAELVALAGYWLLFHRFFSDAEYRLPLRFSAEVGLGELGAFVIVPFGAGGPALRIWALLRAGMPYRTLMRRATAHDIAFNLPYIAVAVVLGVAAAAGLLPGHLSLLLALSPLGIVAAVGAGGLAVLWYAGQLERRGGRPGSRAAWVVRETVLAVPPGVADLRTRWRDPVVWGAATAYWAGDCGVLVLAVHAAGGSAPVLVVALAYMLGQLGNLLPLPGGVGGLEPIVAGVLTASGVGLGLAGAAIVLYRLVSLTLQATAGAVGIASLTAVPGRIPRLSSAG